MQIMKNRTAISRRAFLGHAATFAAAGVVAPCFVPARVFGANDRINVGIIGIGRQASGLLQELLRQKDAAFVAVADVNRTRANEMKAKHNATPYQDFRRLLENKDVDAIITATPEHWRSNICIPACQAGKDLYAEKPVSLTIHEGRLMVQAARKYRRIFQVGSQQRSNWIDRQACALVRDGGLGKVLKVYAPNYPSPWHCALPEQPVPAELDWEMWCGPNPRVPYNKDLYAPRANPGWLSFRPYSGGEMTGWGAHGFDMIQFAMGMDESGPTEVWTEGAKIQPPTYTAAESKSRGDKLCSANKVFFRYGNGVVMELADQMPKPAFDNNKVPGFGGIFVCEKGTFKIDRGRVESNPDEIGIELSRKRPRGLNDGHIRNWLDCIKSRKLPNADIEIGHRSATVCHLGNIARELHRKLQWDPKAEKFIGDAEADKLLDRERRAPWVLPKEV
jgi:predicted dehydrogenase